MNFSNFYNNDNFFHHIYNRHLLYILSSAVYIIFMLNKYPFCKIIVFSYASHFMNFLFLVTVYIRDFQLMYRMNF